LVVESRCSEEVSSFNSEGEGMEILWTALGISVIVIFVFYVLAQHWQKLLRQQSGTIARLSERLRDIEDVADPEFLRRINDAAPSPLEQVFTFSFRLSDIFWNKALGIAAEDLRFIRAIGSVPASVKIERWRGHSVATITEVLPESKAAGWRTRSLDLYAESTKGGEAIILWDIPLARPRHDAERPPSLELLFHSNSLELRGHLLASVSGNGHAGKSGEDETLFFRVPLDAPGLAEFQSYNAPQAGDHDKVNSGGAGALANDASWQASYGHEDESAGFEWQLCVRDLRKKAEWKRWKILEPTAIAVLGGEK
jgi:hypothetical protein